MLPRGHLDPGANITNYINENTSGYQTHLSTECEMHIPSGLGGVVHRTYKQTERSTYVINDIDLKL